MKHHAVALVSLLAFLSPPAVASAATAARYAYVTKVNVGEDSYVRISVAADFQASQAGNCTLPAVARSRYPLTDERTKALLRVALASLIMFTTVEVTTDGCARGGELVWTGIQIERPVATQVTSPAVPPKMGLTCRAGAHCCHRFPDGSCTECVPPGGQCR
jgi:hypothetical protein